MKLLLIASMFLFFDFNEVMYHHLSWADFKGKPTAPGLLAVTTTGWVLNTTCSDNDGCAFELHSVLYRDQSFTISHDPYILRHEQGHFDITEIYARCYMHFTFGHLTERQLEVNKESWWKYCQEIQARYDKETGCAVNKEKQTEWDKVIAQNLEYTKKGYWRFFEKK